jgi:predicted proteasome-type protease
MLLTGMNDVELQVDEVPGEKLLTIRVRFSITELIPEQVKELAEELAKFLEKHGE